MFGENDIVHCKDTVIALFNVVPVRNPISQGQNPSSRRLGAGWRSGEAYPFLYKRKNLKFNL